jgi:hypothetical protein
LHVTTTAPCVTENKTDNVCCNSPQLCSSLKIGCGPSPAVAALGACSLCADYEPAVDRYTSQQPKWQGRGSPLNGKRSLQGALDLAEQPYLHPNCISRQALADIDLT